MPDIDEHQRLINENLKYSLQEQQYLKVINNLIPDIWGEIGKIQTVIVFSNKFFI
jgi:Leucine-rich repeat (LRR) protein